MRRPLQLGIIGTGVAATELYLPAFKELKSAIRIVACANRRRAKAEAFARKAKVAMVVDSAEALIAMPDVDAVLISLPIHLLPKYILLALRSKKAVLSEKPLAPSVAEGKKLLRAASRFDTPWLVGENFAFMDHARQLQALIKKGRLGEVRVVEATQMTKMDKRNPYFNTAWRTKPKHVGGFVSDGGVHLANLVRRCFGMPAEICGYAASFDPKLLPIDTVMAALRFESGAVGTWRTCFSAVYNGPMLRVYGSRANAELTWDKLTLLDHKGNETIVVNQRNSFAVQFQHFADVVQRGKAVEMTPAEALLDLELVDSLCRLAR